MLENNSGGILKLVSCYAHKLYLQENNGKIFFICGTPDDVLQTKDVMYQ
jgi:hypothetical protein